jgi:hypothetical protein
MESHNYGYKNYSDDTDLETLDNQRIDEIMAANRRVEACSFDFFPESS